MKKGERFLFCMVLALIGNFLITMQAQASCTLPATTHAANITELSNLLPADTRGALAADTSTLAAQITDLLNGTEGDPALKEPINAINELAENINLAGVMHTAFLVQTTDASDGFFLLAKLTCDGILEVTTPPDLTPAGTYGAGAHQMYVDVNGNSLSLLTGGVLVVGKLAAVQSVLDVADGVSSANASLVDPFKSALLSGSPFSFVYGLPAMFNGAILADRSLRGAELVSGSLDFTSTNISGSLSFHTSNASAFVTAYNDLDSAADEIDLTLSGPIANGLSQVVVTIPSTPINKTGNVLINSRNNLKKLFHGMKAYDYAEDVEEGGNKPLLALTVTSEQDDAAIPGPVFIRWEFKDQDAIDAFNATELPAGFTLADCQFLEDDAPGKFLALNLYQSGGGSIVKGARAEWDIFVNPPVGADPGAGTRPRFLVIDALAEAISADAKHGLTQAEPLSHYFSGGNVVTSVAKYDTDGVTEIPVFSSSFTKPNPVTASVAHFTREMATGNDYVYWAHGVYDRTLYNASAFNYDAYYADLSTVTITRNDHWAQYLADDPTYVIYYVNTLEYVGSPWDNLDSEFLDFSDDPTWLDDLLEFKYNEHERTWMRDAVVDSFRGQGDAIAPMVVENITPATYYNFEITDPPGMAAALDLPTGYSLAQTHFFDSDTAEVYYLTLSIYEIKDSIEGTRAEWSVYVDDGNGREHLMVVDLQTEDAAVDPVSMINLPSKVGHSLSAGTLSTSLSSSTIEFNASFNTGGATTADLSMDWIEAGELVCHLNGICDKLYYGGETLDVPVHVPSSTTVAISTPWNDFIDTTPSAVFYRDNSQAYATKPWHNLKVWVDDPVIPDPDPCIDGTHDVVGTGTMIGRTSSAVNSTYNYIGSAVLEEDDNELEFCYNQEITNALGGATMRFTGSFDLTTGQGTKITESCTPDDEFSSFICAGFIPNLESVLAVQNVDISDLDNITWDIIFEFYIDAMGWADSNSTLSAVVPDCTDNDNDLFSIEGGVCGEIDCDDSDPLINPEAKEIPFDLIDSNCDGNTNCFIGTASSFQY